MSLFFEMHHALARTSQDLARLDINSAPEMAELYGYSCLHLCGWLNS
jgi:hypothetical protein